MSSGLVSEQKSQTAETRACLTEAPPTKCGARSQAPAGGRACTARRCNQTVLPPAPGSHTPSFPHAVIRGIRPSPRPCQPLPLPQCPASTRHDEAAWWLVQPTEEQSHLTNDLLGIHATPGPHLTLELSTTTNHLFRKSIKLNFKKMNVNCHYTNKHT